MPLDRHGYYGKDGDDLLVGGTGDDTLEGGNGSDTYRWSKGDGDDLLDENGASETEIDRLVLTDVNPDEVVLSRANHSWDAELTVSSGGTIRLHEQFKTGKGIEAIEFADGTVWTSADIFARTKVTDTDAATRLHGTNEQDDNLYGLGGNDTLEGKDGDDLLVGGTGVDTLYGDDGSDTYEWSKGDGDDLLDDNGTSTTENDRLILTDVNPNEVVLSRANHSWDAELTVSSGGTIRLHEQFKTGKGIEAIEFADGTVWTSADIFAHTMVTDTDAATRLHGTNEQDDNLYGLGGNDTLEGKDGDDLLVGGTGVDTLYGDDGSDTYEWSKGDGDDLLDDNGTSTTENDRLILTDVNPNEVVLSRANHSWDAELTVSSGGTIRLHEQFKTGKGIEAIEFADGTVWTSADIFAHTMVTDTDAATRLHGTNEQDDNLYGLGGNDTLEGKDGDDLLVGGTGNDTLEGGNGSDTYRWSKGDGDDLLDENGASETETDRLILTDVNPDEVVLSRANHSWDAELTVSSGGTIRLHEQFKTGKGIEAIEFADGTVWTSADIFAHTMVTDTDAATRLHGTNEQDDNLYGLGGNDTLYGKDGDDLLVGGEGDDRLEGGNGNDVYVWARGDGNDTIHVKAEAGTDTLRLVDVASDEVELTWLGDDYTYRFQIGVGADEDLYLHDVHYGIVIEFSDGVVLDVMNSAAIRNEQYGTDGPDEVNVIESVFDFPAPWAYHLYGHDGDDTP
jgi:Ca2+-binding RTX toxin-like protein